MNRTVDRATAEAITGGQLFLEVIVAPAYAPDALELLKARWKNVRLLEVSGEWRVTARTSEFQLHKITGGYLVQDRDTAGLNEGEWKVVSARAPGPKDLEDLRIAWLACKH